MEWRYRNLIIIIIIKTRHMGRRQLLTPADFVSSQLIANEPQGSPTTPGGHPVCFCFCILPLHNIYTQDVQTLNPKRASCGIRPASSRSPGGLRPGEKHRPGASRPPYGAWTMSVGLPYCPRLLSVRLNRRKSNLLRCGTRI